MEEEALVGEEVLAEVPTVPEPALTSAETAEPLPALDTAFVSPPDSFKSKKKKKQSVKDRESEEDDRVGARKVSREAEVSIDEDEEY